MLKNYLKIAWRNMLRDKQFSILNLMGLATGIVCTFIIYLWVTDELSVDKFHKNGARIFQLMERRNYGGKISISDESSGLLGETVALQIPAVAYSATVAPTAWFQKFALGVGDKIIKANGQYVGKDYFNIFSYKLLEGNSADVLKSNTAIVLSASLAKRLFGTTEHLIGKPVRIQQDTTFFVSGIFEDLPANASEQFECLFAYDYYKATQTWVNSWYNLGPHNFVLLRNDANPDAFNKQLSYTIKKNSSDTSRTAFAVPFEDAYLQNSYVHGASVGSKMEYVRLFSIIAIFILGIACINFMNLSTAKAARRFKEVGIKKVVGASRRQLIFQFLSESVLLTFLAMILAAVLVMLFLPRFNIMTGKHLSLIPNFKMLEGALAITLITGIISGSYPALYLSRFSPISILKDKLKTSIGELFVRKGLVIFQFVVTISLIIAVLVVYKQIALIQSVNLGYNKNNILRFNAEGNILKNEQSFVDALKAIPGVVNSSYTAHNLIGRNFGGDMIDWEGKNPNSFYYFEGMNAGYNFIETMEMQLLEGRSFSKDFGNDSASLVINETAAHTMGMKNPVGKTVEWFGKKAQIVGLVKDFHFESLHATVQPLYIALEKNSTVWDQVMVKINGADQQKTISAIQQAYNKFNPGFPFEFQFLDAAYQKQYIAESRVSVLSRYFAALAILISCLGLFGLATFTAQRRQKEIGIRKIIGASVFNILLMLSKDFLILVFIAMIISFPLAWWAMNSWLNGYAYRAPFNLNVFFIAGACILLITVFTIGYQSLRAALGNPVKSLRTE